MATRLLIPIDFTVESLNTLRLALEQHRDERVAVLLLYAESLTDSIAELILYSSRRTVEQLSTPVFNDALSILRNRHESCIEHLGIQLFHGVNVNAFRGFAQANKIDLIYIPGQYKLQITGRAFNPIPLIRKSKLTVREVSWPANSRATGDDQLDHLFQSSF